jgi:hypothetical protein
MLLHFVAMRRVDCAASAGVISRLLSALHFVAMRRVDCAASARLEFGLRFELLLKTKTELGSFRILDLGSSLGGPSGRPVSGRARHGCSNPMKA